VALEPAEAGSFGEFCAYGIGTENLQSPPVEWRGTDTYIQRTGINHDFGVFDSRDGFHAKHDANLSGLRRLLYVHGIRHLMNARVDRIRKRALRGIADRDRLPSQAI